MFVKLDRELTKDDVGKKVKLRNGNEVEILHVDPQIEIWTIDTATNYHRSDGTAALTEGYSHSDDIVEIEHVDEYIDVADIPKKSSYDPYYSTIQINIQSGMTVIKGSFKDSNGEEWYVSMDKV
jgi:hypothetical protein